jgi:hypothetical protein
MAGKTSKSSKENTVSESYNRFKSFDGKTYTGMAVGRSHKWYYDQGVWRDTKITPDLWSISYAVTKRRAGHAPKKSGASVGTDYHWLILAHQNVEKLNADDYSTEMTGLKFKLAHKRADKKKWSLSGKTQRKHLINFLREMISQLEQEPVELVFELNGETYAGEAIPVQATCVEGVCHEYEITLNDKHLGLIRKLKNSWKMDLVTDKKLVAAIGKILAQV